MLDFRPVFEDLLHALIDIGAIFFKLYQKHGSDLKAEFLFIKDRAARANDPVAFEFLDPSITACRG